MPFDPEDWTGPLVAAGLVMLAAGTALAPGPGVLLLAPGVGLLGLACVSARSGFLLFGPFLRFELMRHLRRWRVHLWLTVPPLLGGTFFVCAYVIATDGGTRPPVQQVSEATSQLFLVLVALFAMSVALLATVRMTAATVEDRKAKRTDFLLVTDLRGREIVIGRAVAGLIVVAVYPLALLPLAVALPPLFGADPAVMLVGVGFAAVTLFSVVGFMCLSAVPPADRRVGRAIGVVFFALVAAAVAGPLLQGYPRVWAFPGTPTAPAAVSVADVVGWANVGNPFARPGLTGMITGGGDPAVAADELRGYAAFHLCVGVLGFALAAGGVRVPVEPARVGPKPVAVWDRPPVSDRPIFWKEVHLHLLAVAGRRRSPRIVRAVFYLTVVGVLLGSAVSDFGGYATQVRHLGPMITVMWGWGSILGASMTALSSLPAERERDTLTSLLTTPLPRAEIALDRLRAAAWAVRWSPVGTGVVAVAAAVAGLFPWAAIPALLLVQVVQTYQTVGLAGVGAATVPDRQSIGDPVGRYVLVMVLLPAALAGLTLLVPVVGRYAAVGVCLSAAPFLLLLTDKCPPDELPWYAAGLLAGLGVHTLIGRWAWGEAARRFDASCELTAREGR